MRNRANLQASQVTVETATRWQVLLTSLLFDCIKAFSRQQPLPKMEFLENLPIYVATKSGLIYKPKSGRHTATQLDLQYEGYCLNQQRSSFASLIELLEELEHYRALINKEFQDKAAAAGTKINPCIFKIS